MMIPVINRKGDETYALLLVIKQKYTDAIF